MEARSSLCRESDLSLLVAEYAGVFADVRANGNHNDILADLTHLLVGDCNWTPSAAAALASLVADYGGFMLRNAAALAIALHVEDGDLRY
jgi:hypothetical protein